MSGMQVIPSRRAPRSRASALPALVSALLGVTLLGVGLGLGYLAFSTSIVARVMGSARPGPVEVALGITAWAVALTAPACFVILGLGRLVHATGPLRRRAPQSISSLVGTLTEEYVGATRVHLPDGYVIPELVIGPHGVAIFEELPPAAVSRQVGGRWEVRMTDGRWLPIENPLDRATRDAERVRRWLATDDRDFVIKVYAAVIGPGSIVPRTPTCAVIERDQIPAFLASLPPQRSLTPTRLQRIVEHVDAAV
jgi:hypothetical protein